jgi:predicted amidohydrolase
MKRLLHLLDNAASQGAELALFPEIAFTTFFPRYLLEGEELDKVNSTHILSPNKHHTYLNLVLRARGRHESYANKATI